MKKLFTTIASNDLKSLPFKFDLSSKRLHDFKSQGCYLFTIVFDTIYTKSLSIVNGKKRERMEQ